jgi:twitching motility protein PilT
VTAAGISVLLEALFERAASDLLLSVSTPPALRVDGRLVPMDLPALTPEDTDRMTRELLSPQQRLTFNERHSVDFSFEWSRRGRVRGNAFRQRGTVALALRAIPTAIPTFEDIGLPQSVAELTRVPHGLILVTGPTGCGKSTTQASFINSINHDRGVHVITIEDPIEYIHVNDRAIIEQREVGVDAPSFADALRSALREDPDVVLVGEMRDLESISTALTVAETGHLVLGTLHTNDAMQATHRIIDVFPAGQQQQIRVQLASTLLAVVHQELLPRVGGGRVAAFEVMMATAPVRALIREDKAGQLRNVMATSAKDGMCTLETALSSLVQEGVVSYDDAVARSLFPLEVKASESPEVERSDERRLLRGDAEDRPKMAVIGRR